MANFQPAPGPGFVPDYITKLSPGLNSNLCAGNSSIITYKMARRTVLALETSALVLSVMATSSTKFSAFGL